MQYILSEEEMNRGHKLRLAWEITSTDWEELFQQVQELIPQGYYTCIVDNLENETYALLVFELSE
jgi:hypothetical protein